MKSLEWRLDTEGSFGPSRPPREAFAKTAQTSKSSASSLCIVLRSISRALLVQCQCAGGHWKCSTSKGVAANISRCRSWTGKDPLQRNQFEGLSCVGTSICGCVRFATRAPSSRGLQSGPAFYKAGGACHHWPCSFSSYCNYEGNNPRSQSICHPCALELQKVAEYRSTNP